MKNIIDRKYVSLFLCSCTYPLLICHWRKRKGERKILTCFLKFIKSGLYYNANQISGNNWKKKSPTAANTIKLYTSVITLLSPVLQSLIDFIKKLYPLYKKTTFMYYPLHCLYLLLISYQMTMCTTIDTFSAFFHSSFPHCLAALRCLCGSGLCRNFFLSYFACCF